MTYEEWDANVHDTVKRDATWHVQAYRLGLYMADCAWLDCERLAADPRGASAAQQLVRAVGSVPANVAEGYAKAARRIGSGTSSMRWGRSRRPARGT